MVTWPAAGTSWPLSAESSVLLPAPLGPMMATSSPGCTTSDTLSSNRLPEDSTATPCASIISQLPPRSGSRNRASSESR